MVVGRLGDGSWMRVVWGFLGMGGGWKGRRGEEGCVFKRGGRRMWRWRWMGLGSGDGGIFEMMSLVSMTGG